ncbi:hypothetical protein KZZ07_13650 [Mameliella sp. CS4]|uniref:hypothetical protein n=1 Tax=Mameliella sp. CS4 TaxID=2862329 RepID=UPI001C5DEC20|nr:hypothetical protein [Mameliella sp. CS4]
MSDEKGVAKAAPLFFGSVFPKDLAQVVGQGVSVDLTVEDPAADFECRSFEIALAPGGWMLRTRIAFSPTTRTAADVRDQLLDMNEFGVAGLAAIAHHQTHRPKGQLWQGDQP